MNSFAASLVAIDEDSIVTSVSNTSFHSNSNKLVLGRPDVNSRKLAL